MKFTHILSVVIFMFCFGSFIFGQGRLPDRIREMRQRTNQDPQSYISDVPNTVQKSFEFEGLKRTFLVHRTGKADAKKDVPMVLCFHGGMGTGKRVERQTGFSQIADRENFIVVYPDGVKNQWNDGRGDTYFGAPTANDVGFISALIDFMRKNYPVDEKRIYATGISNGGFFTNRLGVELSDRLAAIAPVAANLVIDPKTGKPLAPQAGKTAPLSVLMINGTADPLVKWDGGRSAGTGRISSVAESATAWAKSNACAANPGIENLPDKFADDRTTVRRETYSGCKNSAEVVLYAVVGGGHSWHNSRGEQPQMLENITGNTSREINSIEIIWQFFKKHAK